MASAVSQQPKRNCLESLGRISNLPEEIITKILVHMPIKDAVGTSRLSRAWRFRWMSIPELVFDRHSIIQGRTYDHWISFINNVLLLHGGDVTKVELRNLLESACEYVDRWLLLLWRKKLSYLRISFMQPIPYRCPSTLFYCQDLKTLILEGCGLQLPPQTQFGGFRNLTALTLHNVTMSKETVESLVNNSLHLRQLYLLPSEIISHLRISAPHLRTCQISRFDGITFIQTPKLRTIWLRNNQNARCKLDGALAELVQDCRIYHPFVECLTVNNIWERVPIIYRRLTNVFLGMNFEDPKQILAAVWLFRSSPLIRKLHIAVRMYHAIHYEHLPIEEFYATLDKRESILGSLEIIEFMGLRVQIRN